MSLALIQRVKELEEFRQQLERAVPVATPDAPEGLEALKARLLKLEMQYRALNARVSKVAKAE